jgi:hypothetical protein
VYACGVDVAIRAELREVHDSASTISVLFQQVRLGWGWTDVEYVAGKVGCQVIRHVQLSASRLL